MRPVRLQLLIASAIGFSTIGIQSAHAQDDSLVADLASAMTRQVNYCWTGVDDLPAHARAPISVEFSLHSDGTLAGPVSLIRQDIEADFDPDINTAEQRAIVAVQRCAPYKMPEEYYDSWKQVRVYFGPSVTPPVA